MSKPYRPPSPFELARRSTRPPPSGVVPRGTGAALDNVEIPKPARLPSAVPSVVVQGCFWILGPETPELYRWFGRR